MMRKKNIKRQIWIDLEEDNLVKEKLRGLSESEFIRSMIKGYKIKDNPQ